MMQPRPFRPGFTLVELLVVLAIISIVLGVAVPASYAGTTNRPQREEIERLRRAAVRDGVAHTDTIAFGRRTVRATAWPGGFVLIDSGSLGALPAASGGPGAP